MSELLRNFGSSNSLALGRGSSTHSTLVEAARSDNFRKRTWRFADLSEERHYSSYGLMMKTRDLTGVRTFGWFAIYCYRGFGRLPRRAWRVGLTDERTCGCWPGNFLHDKEPTSLAFHSSRGFAQRSFGDRRLSNSFRRIRSPVSEEFWLDRVWRTEHQRVRFAN